MANTAKKKTKQSRIRKVLQTTKARATDAEESTKFVDDYVKPQPTKLKRYSSFRLQKRIQADQPVVMGGFKIFKESFGLFRRNWKVFLGIVLIYGIVNVILVQSFANFSITEAKAALEDVFAGQWNQIAGSFSLFAYLVGTSSASNTQTAGVYRFILLLVTSLATIWALRQVYQDIRVRVRDAYYKGMYPIIPFVLVLAVIVLQLLPLAIGSYLYSFASKGAILGSVELVLWVTALFMLTLLSLYFISSSLFALYIVCLPNVTPMVALRSARNLVRHRRWTVMRRILLLPVMLFVVGAIIVVPIILYLTPAAIWVFFALNMIAIPVGHAYMYRLYRELL
ncbi:MAG: hypothetical protein ABWX94_01040 [Candidatus Saccharimonadales bacterium]